MSSGSGRPPAKIVVVGPFDAGKSTLLATVAGPDAITTERAISDPDDPTRGGGSGSTTVAIEFARVSTNAGDALVYGTPGQPRFSFVWDAVAPGMHAWILLVDATAGDFDEAARLLTRWRDTGTPGLVAVNKDPSGTARAAVADALGLSPDDVRGVDARDPASAHALLTEAVALAAPSIATRETSRLRRDV